MIVYNVTTKVSHAIKSDWLLWMQQEHIPEVVATGCFTHAVIMHLVELDETDGPTYAIQYHAESRADYNRYIQTFSQEMRRKVAEKWGDQLVAFRTVMHIVN